MVLVLIPFGGNATMGDTSIWDYLVNDFGANGLLLFTLSLPLFLALESFFFVFPFSSWDKIMIVIQGLLALAGGGIFSLSTILGYTTSLVTAVIWVYISFGLVWNFCLLFSHGKWNILFANRPQKKVTGE
jgi:hypothetical protein